VVERNLALCNESATVSPKTACSSLLSRLILAMADTTSADITSTPNDGDSASESIWTSIIGTDRITDPGGWNKDWEKFLQTIVASDVYATMGRMFRKGSKEPSVLLDFTQRLKAQVCLFQNALAKLWDEMEKTDSDHFETAWLLLDEKERKRHLMNGLEKVCKDGMFMEDNRALCPEITISSILKLNGQAFIDFIRSLTAGIKGAGADDAYFLPSEWWDKAVDDLPPSLSEKFEPSTSMLLTLMRNEFISEFIEPPLIDRDVVDHVPFFPARFMLDSAMSVLHDLSYGSPGMDPVTELMKSDGAFAHTHSRTMAMMNHKPVIRCENCTKRPEDVEGNPKFMVCSACKSKLDFIIHYCSP
jgi:hypothetical protein